MSKVDPTVVPVILSGGSGTRLWPLSRKLSPKQFVPMLSGRSLFQDTVERAAAATGTDPLVVCNEAHRFVVEEQLEAVGVSPRAVILEPVPRNTSAAIAAAACVLAESDPGAHLLVLPSDHYVPNAEAFAADVRTALAAAAAGYLVTFGITPSCAHTGYGYIRQGAPIAGVPGTFDLEEFVEKPALPLAERYVAEGKWHWNSGMFLMPARALLSELSRYEPGIFDSISAAVARAGRVDHAVLLDGEAFATSPDVSIDYAVMERTSLAAVVPTRLQWNDVGAWSSMWEVSEHDANGNVAHGNVIAVDTVDSYVHSDGPLVATLGVAEVTVVATKDAVLVTDRAHSQEVRAIVDELHGSDRPEADAVPVCRRPWGTFESIHRGDRHRAEHWVVVRGTARVTRGEETLTLTENMSLFVDRGEIHRIENPGTEPLHVIEVQVGDYLGEDDIERLDDCYGRA
jgi:mannose-1-phosphate guanylyltransferase/mannose-6-phosphate isomerase